MTRDELQNRTKQFALNVIKFLEILPYKKSISIISN